MQQLRTTHSHHLGASEGPESSSSACLGLLFKAVAIRTIGVEFSLQAWLLEYLLPGSPRLLAKFTSSAAGWIAWFSSRHLKLLMTLTIPVPCCVASPKASTAWQAPSLQTQTVIKSQVCSCGWLKHSQACCLLRMV